MADRSAFLGRVERAPGVLRRLAAVAAIDRVQRAVGVWGRRSAMLAACFALAVQARAQEIVRAGFSDSPPISWRNASTKDLQGLAVSVFRAVAGEAGFTMHADLLSFGVLLSSLTEKKLDVVTMSGTPERRRVAIFSQPFAKYGETLLVRAEDTTDYVELAQLKGKRVGSNAGGGWLDAARTAGRCDDQPLSSNLCRRGAKCSGHSSDGEFRASKQPAPRDQGRRSQLPGYL